MENNFKKNQKQHLKNQIKKVKPARKSMRGVAETIYGETKKNTAFSLTPTASKNLRELSTELGITKSELLERISRKGEEIKKIFAPNADKQNDLGSEA